MAKPNPPRLSEAQAKAIAHAWVTDHKFKISQKPDGYISATERALIRLAMIRKTDTTAQMPNGEAYAVYELTPLAIRALRHHLALVFVKMEALEG